MVLETIDASDDVQVINEALIRDGIQVDGNRTNREEIRQKIEFRDVHVLSLSYKNLISIIHLNDFHALTKLQLDNNQIKKIENLESLTNLKWLDLSFNQIEKIEGLDSLTKLTDLSLFSNQIQKIEGLDCLSNLEILSIGNNRISSIEDVDYLRRLKHLRVLKLAGNPISKTETYRSYVLSRLSDLTSLDYRRLLQEELSEAKEHYQDDLLEITEKEESLAEEAQAVLKQKATEELLSKANLSGVETLLSRMENDENWKNLCQIPGMSEAWNETRNKVANCIEDFKAQSVHLPSPLPYYVFQTAMFEQLDTKTKECELWIDATSSYLLEKTETSKSLIIEFEKQKKRLHARVLDGKSRGRDVASSLKSKLSALNDALFGIEEQVVEVQLQFNGDYESNSDDLSSKRKSIFATFFTQIRDSLNGLASKAHTIGLGLHEKYVRESDIDKLSEEVKVYFQDKEALVTALQNSHDLKVSKVDTLEEELLHEESFRSQQDMLERELAMKRRHCGRVNEIISYIELNASEIEELEQTTGY